MAARQAYRSVCGEASSLARVLPARARIAAAARCPMRGSPTTCPPPAAQTLFAVRCFASSSRHPRPSSDPSVVPPADATGQTVALDAEHYPAPSDGSASARTQHDIGSIVVCHGLFGSKQNWRSLGRAMAKRFGVPVYALDLRNHGTSPHIDGLAYADMAADVLRFIREHKLSKVMLIGHSMGGKVAQAFALASELPEGTLQRLVAIDIAPARGPISKEFEQYIDAMLEIQKAKLEKRTEADAMLAKTEPDLGVRQFLLTNLQRMPAESTWSFRVPLESIQDHISQIGDFPYDTDGITSDDGKQRPHRKWEGKTLFVKGAKSKYINKRNIPICQAYFPNSEVVTLDTGHWVQAEKPNEFVLELEKFLQK